MKVINELNDSTEDFSKEDIMNYDGAQCTNNNTILLLDGGMVFLSDEYTPSVHDYPEMRNDYFSELQAWLNDTNGWQIIRPIKRITMTIKENKDGV